MQYRLVNLNIASMDILRSCFLKFQILKSLTCYHKLFTIYFPVEQRQQSQSQQYPQRNLQLCTLAFLSVFIS